MRHRQDKRVVETRYEPIGDDGKWERRVLWERRVCVLECGHVRAAAVPAGSKRGAASLCCYECYSARRLEARE
jgi:hypothetical protein